MENALFVCIKKNFYFFFLQTVEGRKEKKKKKVRKEWITTSYIYRNGYWFFTYMWMSVYPLVLSYLHMNVGEWRYVLNILICRNFYDSIFFFFCPDHHLYGMDFYYFIDFYFLLELFTTLFLHMDYLSAHTAICT